MSRTDVCDAVLLELALAGGNARQTTETMSKRMKLLGENRGEDPEEEKKFNLRAAREAIRDAQPELDTALDRARDNDCLPEQIPGQPGLSIERKLKDSIFDDVRRDAGLVNRSDTVIGILEEYLD